MRPFSTPVRARTNAKELSLRYPEIDVNPERVVRGQRQDSDFGGRRGGLDLCLHLVRRDLGAEVAARTVEVAGDSTIGARDRALILLGFAGAFRRSELVGLNVEDCQFGKDGLTVTLRRSKTDQDGAGRKIGIPYGSNPETCPVRTMQAWMEQVGVGARRCSAPSIGMGKYRRAG